MPERIILDPAEKIEGRTELEITDWVDVEGINWGDAEMEAYRAEAEIGESVLDFRLPNRQIVAPLIIKEAGGTSFAKARSYIQAKAALYMREGGIGKRILSTGGTVYFDVVANGLTLGGDWLQANRGVDVNAELRMEALPDFYEPEALIAEAEEKTATDLIKVIPDPGGDMPARVRLEVTDKQGADQMALVWAFRSGHYSSEATAKTSYEAEELQVLDVARKAALTGASGGTVVQHGTISTSWTPIVRGRIGGTAFPTHTGTNRFFARCYSTSGTQTRARLIWDVGDLANPTENEAVRFPGGTSFFLLDLGEVRLGTAPVGAHRWDWLIQAAGDIGKEDFKADKVFIVNTDDGMGVLNSPPGSGEIGLSSFAVRDEYNQSAGTLSGKTPVVGAGNWAEEGATGAYLVNATERAVERTAVSDGANWKRAWVQGATYTNLVLQGSFRTTALGSAGTLGGGFGLGKRINESLFIAAGLAIYDNNPNNGKLVVSTGSAHPAEVPFPIHANVNYSLKIRFTSSGLIFVWAGLDGAALSGDPQIVIHSDAYATAGTYGQGYPMIADRWGFENAATRYVDSFAGWVPAADAVVFSSQKAQITTQGAYRLDSGGSAYGPVSRVIGDLPRLPAGGLEGRSTELFIKPSRGDMDRVPDSAIDDVAVKVYASRSWLTVPGTI